MPEPRRTPTAPRGRALLGSVARALRLVIAHTPDALPVLALAAAALARLAPSGTLAGHTDLLLAGLVLVTALDIDPLQLLAVQTRWRTVLLLGSLPLPVLGLSAWGIAQLVHGDASNGVLVLGLSPTEVASVGLIGLVAGPAELAIAVLAVSLVLSAVLAPPLLGLLASGAHGVPVLPLLGRFGLIVILPLVLGLLIRGTRPQLARHEGGFASSGSLLVVLLVYASLSDTSGGALVSPALVSGAFLTVSAVLAVISAQMLKRRDDRPLALTIGMRDFAVAAALAAGAFGPGAAQVAGVYGVLMLLAGTVVTGLTRRTRVARR